MKWSKSFISTLHDDVTDVISKFENNNKECSEELQDLIDETLANIENASRETAGSKLGAWYSLNDLRSKVCHIWKQGELEYGDVKGTNQKSQTQANDNFPERDFHFDLRENACDTHTLVKREVEQKDKRVDAEKASNQSGDNNDKMERKCTDTVEEADQKSDAIIETKRHKTKTVRKQKKKPKKNKQKVRRRGRKFPRKAIYSASKIISDMDKKKRVSTKRMRSVNDCARKAEMSLEQESTYKEDANEVVKKMPKETFETIENISLVQLVPRLKKISEGGVPDIRAEKVCGEVNGYYKQLFTLLGFPKETTPQSFFEEEAGKMLRKFMTYMYECGLRIILENENYSYNQGLSAFAPLANEPIREDDIVEAIDEMQDHIQTMRSRRELFLSLTKRKKEKKLVLGSKQVKKIYEKHEIHDAARLVHLIQMEFARAQKDIVMSILQDPLVKKFPTLWEQIESIKKKYEEKGRDDSVFWFHSVAIRGA